jgi:hypothetical protein
MSTTPPLGTTKYYSGGQEVPPPQPPSQMDRIEAVLAEIRDLLQGRVPLPAVPYEHLAAVMGSTAAERFDGPSVGVSGPLTMDGFPQCLGFTTGVSISDGVGTVWTPAPGKAGPACIYPNPMLTPGVPNAQVTQANIAETIGRVGWTATIRPPVSTTSIIKQHIMQRDGLTGDPSQWELDHFISLELGGHPSALGNLWCQPYTVGIPAGMGARAKDRVETALKVMIVGGLISLAEGQRRIKTDWYAEYLNLHKMGLLPMMLSYDPDGSSDPDDNA